MCEHLNMWTSLEKMEMLRHIQYRSQNIDTIFRRRWKHQEYLASKRIKIYFDDTVHDLIKFAVRNYPSYPFGFISKHPSFEESSLQLIEYLVRSLKYLDKDYIRQIFMKVMFEQIETVQNSLKKDTMDEIELDNDDIKQGYQSKPLRQKNKIEKIKKKIIQNIAKNENMVWIYRNFPVIEESSEQKAARLEAEKEARKSAALFQRHLDAIKKLENEQSDIINIIAIKSKKIQRIPTDQLEHEVIVDNLKTKLSILSKLIEKETDVEKKRIYQEDYDRILGIVQNFESVFGEWDVLLASTEKDLDLQKIELNKLEEAILEIKTKL